ncbi:Beta-glucosidase-like glycosyl hydrolase [Hyella patelloides LEGE 07179]|uniref:beta-N-acetylhexosaminidase n=1 Tax=Hyella patelloides LEGE 07179 TaxID=945734 RepID=A0A563VKS3_9CYAN|nr:glycoside hydrolase family 3 N-terminal domain-containing protein [Hyella patelloides]VEP12012.1 Beta-glucosidase-like glycosyl hydrolase [Hyella patelloides LEGE 07179]
MNLKAKIGQMIVVRASGYLSDRQRLYPQWEADNQTLQKWLQELNLGGVILLGGSAVELRERSQQLQSWAQTPLLIAADIEEGVGQRFSGKSWFPPPMAIGAIAKKDLVTAQKYATQMGAITAQEAISLGINWLLAPVVDVNNNPNNPVINIRAFSDRQDIVSPLTTAFIEGAQPYPILTTAKHFPGHGDTAIDSHLDLPVINHDESRLQEIELPPFKSAIAKGVDSVMTAHLTIPAWDNEHPATLSQSILTGKLRQELGFNGLIITDALIMGGITKYASPEEIAVMAIDAGVDILLMPDNPQVAIDSIYQAVISGKISEARIDRSLNRIIAAKRKTTREVSVKPLEEGIENENNSLVVVREIIEDSLQTGGNLPLQIPTNNPCRNLIVVDDVLNSNFLDLSTPAIAIPQQLGYQRQILDQNSLQSVSSDRKATLLQLFIRGNPFRGSAGLTSEAIAQYSQLLKSDLAVGEARCGQPEGLARSDRLIALIIYGSPYVLEWFLPRLKPDLPWVFTYGQMALAQAIALKTLFNLSSSQDREARYITNMDNFGF